MRVSSPHLTGLVLVALCCLIEVTKSDLESSGVKGVNFRASTQLQDGEYEVRMRFGNVLVRETSAISPNPNGERKGLLLRQVASDSHFLQMIYKTNDKKAPRRRNKLIECEVTNDWDAADAFRTQFSDELRRSGLSLQIPPNHANQSGTPSVDEYDEFQDEPNETVPQDDMLDLGQGSEEYRNMSVRILRDEEIVGEMFNSFDIRVLQKQCRRLHRRMKQVVDAKTQESQLVNTGYKSSRVKRGIRRIGMIPGTDWCGGGNMASDYNFFAGYVGAERCCRTHDQCKINIPALTSNYNYFNYRLTTVSHCYCDERFRSCLRMANTGSANLVGKLYFNVIQTKCFILKPEKVCVSDSSWWKKCLKYEIKKTAHIKDPKPY